LSVGLIALVSLLVAAEPARPTVTAARRAAGRAPEDTARDHYKTGISLLNAGNISQALIHFRLAQETAPTPANLAMMGHCEYHLGKFKEARKHYEEYLQHESTGAQAETARQRIVAMDRREAVLAIETMPREVEVVLERLDGDRAVKTGTAPGNFPVAAGRWRVTVKKEGYRTETREETVESVDTRPLFFQLERQPGRLEIVTTPPGATLYVRGNRARNPYVQEVEPGAFEVYGEATHWEGRPETYIVAPGERRRIHYQLQYVQRSGRPELIGFWTTAGAMAGGMAVLARLNRTVSSPEDATRAELTASATLVAGGALVGGVIGALSSNAFAPNYIQDNKALFRIGAAWIGAVEGANVGLALRWGYTPALIGGGAGLAAGAVTGILLDDKAPNYGRVATIQSAAAMGMLAGILSVPALALDKSEYTPGAVLAGLNVGLGAGLALAYLPDQNNYGPQWQQVMLINLGTAAGVLAGGMVDIIRQCLGRVDEDKRCEIDTGDPKYTARYALVGGAVGLVSSWLLTQRWGGSDEPTSGQPPLSLITFPTVLPVAGADGRSRPGFGLTSAGRF
jgi:hypothetical protein